MLITEHEIAAQVHKKPPVIALADRKWKQSIDTLHIFTGKM